MGLELEVGLELGVGVGLELVGLKFQLLDWHSRYIG